MELALADELFLIGHDEYSGKTKINNDVLSCGLAAAALGELMLAGTLVVESGRVAAWSARQNGDAVNDQVVAELQKVGTGHPVQNWIQHLRTDIKEVVAHRLGLRGIVRRETSRSLTGRTQVRYPAADPTEATRSVVRLGFLLGRPSEALDLPAALLSSLSTAVGVAIVVPMLNNGQTRDRLEQVRLGLPQELRELVKGVESAIATVALQARG
ncbi:GPP34 family phosphoprotein [Catellatospora sp. KI3]|uniref:GOLPH3/VPS74 family protein n=1 Tax=Catellatospora sp. KI3 TaxID=3041620 RepID=UPI002482E1E7|nr:GPP34 family phosphoprotein [Catellatospora sp. KI3]MDI1462822.1 GPP34 family phosphoprotein [Catellatospora sp. KI3]